MAAGLVAEFDAVVVAAGACKARGVGAEGFDAGVVAGDVVYAVDYLTEQTRALLEGRKPAISAEGKDVVVIGGGDTGNDCMGTAVRQGARTVRQLEYGPRAPKERAASNLWPEWPNVAKTDYGQEEAIALQGDDLREWCADTQKVLLDDAGRARSAGALVRWSAGKPEPVAGSSARSMRSWWPAVSRAWRARIRRVRRVAGDAGPSASSDDGWRFASCYACRRGQGRRRRGMIAGDARTAAAWSTPWLTPSARRRGCWRPGAVRVCRG